jgi:hypothetical protein
VLFKQVCGVGRLTNFQLSETVLRGRTGRGSRRVGQLRKLLVSRLQASLCAGACQCVCARTTAAGLSCLHRAHPHLPGDPCAHLRGPQLILLTRIAVPVQWRCRQSKSRKTLHHDDGRMSWTKGLSAAAPILEEYGLSCENDMCVC